MQAVSRRARYISTVQKEILVQFVENHDNLKTGKFTSTFTFKSAQTLWQQLTGMLNSMSGARKDWRQWRKTWQDLRTKTKYKQAALNRQRLDGTNLELSVESLTPIEERIIGIIENNPLTVPQSSVDSMMTFSVNPDGSKSDEVHTKLENVDEIDDYDGEEEYEDPKDYKDDYDQPENFETSEMLRMIQVQTVEEPTKGNGKSSKSCNCNNIKEEYYKRKLELMERDVTAKNRIANALENIAEKLATNNGN